MIKLSKQADSSIQPLLTRCNNPVLHLCEEKRGFGLRYFSVFCACAKCAKVRIQRLAPIIVSNKLETVMTIKPSAREGNDQLVPSFSYLQQNRLKLVCIDFKQKELQLQRRIHYCWLHSVTKHEISTYSHEQMVLVILD